MAISLPRFIAPTAKIDKKISTEEQAIFVGNKLIFDTQTLK